MRSIVILVKALGLALVAGAGLVGTVAILAGTRYSPFLLTYLDQEENIAVFTALIVITAVAGLGGMVLLRSHAVKKVGIPFIFLLALVTTAGPITGLSFVETQVIKGEIDLNKISSLYNTQAEWEARAATIRQGILKGAELVPLPTRTPLNAVNHSIRTHGNYSVENVYFESLPGFFITGNLYRPAGPGATGIHPAMLIPHGHHNHDGHFAEEIQNIGADFARLGANVFTYDMIGYGESTQMQHETSHALSLQLWNSIRVLDFLLSLNDSDVSRVGMTGASGGGTQTMFLAAVDGRLNISAPVVMISSFITGSSACEDGMPVHKGDGYATNNAEITALHAPRPLLLVSDGDDWTRFTPTSEYPFIQRIYGFYGATGMVENAHFADEEHDYGPSKRNASLHFFASHFNLNMTAMEGGDGHIDESPNVMETADTMRSFTTAYPRPANALTGEDSVLAVMRSLQPGWQPAPAAAIDGSPNNLVFATTCLMAVLVLAVARRKMLVA